MQPTHAHGHTPRYGDNILDAARIDQLLDALGDMKSGWRLPSAWLVCRHTKHVNICLLLGLCPFSHSFCPPW